LTPTVLVSSAPGQLVVDTVEAAPSGVFFVPDPSQTRLWYENSVDFTPPFSSFDIGGGSSKAGASPNVTMSWTLTNSAPWALRAVSIQPAITTAAEIAISGTVRTSRGLPIRNALVIMNTSTGTRSTLTNAFGYYMFDKVQSGQTVLLNASARRLMFAPRAITVSDQLKNIDIVSLP
jgi:hypothetical protein